MVFQVKKLVEKPDPNHAPSNLAIIGRYILTREVFETLEQTTRDADGELQLTDGLRLLLERRPLYACELSGVWHDGAGNQIPVSEITVADNLVDMFARLIPANDLQLRSRTNAPSLMIEDMTIAGR